MILLVGPINWVSQMKKLLTERTWDGNSGSSVHVATSDEHLRGVTEYVEIIVCMGGYSPTPRQFAMIDMAIHMNRMREHRNSEKAIDEHQRRATTGQSNRYHPRQQ